MTTVKENRHSWATIIVGLAILVVTTIYYKSIVDDNVIYNTSVDIFEMYGWTVVLFGSILTVWAYIKIKTLSKMWLLICILLLNITTVIYFKKLLKPMPYQFRFSLTNNTNYDLTELRVIGDKELKLKNLEKGKTLNFVFSDYSENSDIDLICKMENNGIDTLNLAAGMTNSCGYYYDIDLTIRNGQLTKN
jgi:hypothetical protein